MNDLKLSIRGKLYKTNTYGIQHQDPDAKLSDAEVEYLVKTYNINADLHKTCINCQARQMLKYEGTFDHNDVPNDTFKVNCTGIPKSLPPGSKDWIDKVMESKKITREHAIKLLSANYDPVAWAELMFGFDDDTEWKLRSYQKEQLRCTATRYVIRQGRRSGKTFSVCLKMLHTMFNWVISTERDSDGKPVSRGPTIMIVTPYVSQLDTIFSEIQKILRKNVDLTSSVISGSATNLYVKTPFYKMEFKHHGSIIGFVSGVGSKSDGSDGGTMRSRSADMIYLDEMDMIPDGVLNDVVLPILATYPHTRIIATSTPIGKRAHFFNWCTARADYKEDYLPSTVLPHWERVKYDIEADNISEDSLFREYMAKFTDGGFGVFKPSLVYEAQQEYEYTDTVNPDWWRSSLGIKSPEKTVKVMGIDWNKNAGAEFCVIAYDPPSDRWIVCECTNIPQSEFTSQGWMEEVLRLNYKWNLDFVYADEGYGQTTIENLKLHAYRLKAKELKTPFDRAAIKLEDSLKAFNFGSVVEMRSPIDGQVIKKPAKEFLVENAVKCLERRRLYYPRSERTLTDQLLNYVVLRRSPTTHRPVYGPNSDKIADHRLDAFMLALVGIQLQFGLYNGQFAGATTATQISKQALEGELDEYGQLKSVLDKSILKDKVGLNALSIIRAQGMPNSKSQGFPSRKVRAGEQTGDPSLLEHFLRLKNVTGYENDTEHIYEARQQQKLSRTTRPTRLNRRAWLRGEQ